MEIKTGENGRGEEARDGMGVINDKEARDGVGVVDDKEPEDDLLGITTGYPICEGTMTQKSAWSITANSRLLNGSSA
jgi:hypothetical protein